MPSFKIDIDLIFNSLSGRALLMLDEHGRIFKANNDALVLLDKPKIKNLEGKNWDETFAGLTNDDFNFKDLINSSTGFLYYELTNAPGKKVDVLRVKVDKFELTEDLPGTYYFVTCKKQVSGDWEKMLFQVMKGTEKDFGENFLQSVTKALAETLGVDFAFIGSLKKENPVRVKAISFWNKDKYKKPFEYDLAGSPCEEVINKSQKFIPQNVTALYPEDTGLVKLGVESYFGTPIYYSSGKPLGLLVVMDSKPMSESSTSAYILNIFASRIGAEMEWLETQNSLVAKDRKLRNVK